MSVCLSRCGFVSKRMHTQSNFLHRLLARGLEETTRTSPHHMAEHHTAGSEIPRSHTAWSTGYDPEPGLYSWKVINGGRWYDDRTLSVRPTIAIHKRNSTYDCRKFVRKFTSFYDLPAVVVQRIVNRLDRVVTEITLLSAVVKLKFCYQLTLERFVYLFLHLRHFKRHRKRLGVSKVLYWQMNAA